MEKNYGELLKSARTNHDPPISAKGLAEKLKVKAPFVTDIEKGRRLPSLENQEKIKALLANEIYPTEMFDDLAATANDDPRIVAKDIATAVRNSPLLCEIVREIVSSDFSQESINNIALLIKKMGED
jgi:transcriptional regulator with XRE-family HTH domain